MNYSQPTHSTLKWLADGNKLKNNSTIWLSNWDVVKIIIKRSWFLSCSVFTIMGLKTIIPLIVVYDKLISIVWFNKQRINGNLTLRLDLFLLMELKVWSSKTVGLSMIVSKSFQASWPLTLIKIYGGIVITEILSREDMFENCNIPLCVSKHLHRRWFSSMKHIKLWRSLFLEDVE